MFEAAVVLAIGIPAVVIDFRTHRIPNVLVLATLAGALLVSALSGMAGLTSAMMGAVVGLLCFLPPYLAGVMGAGDVKFMAAMGALVGPGGAVFACAVALVAGGALALATIGWRRFATMETVVEGAPGEAPLRAFGQKMPYAAAIVTGVLVTVLINGPRA